MSNFRRFLMMLSQQQAYHEHGYVRDGLVFHLDGIDKGQNQNAWTDLIGGVVFENHGAIPLYDCWLFNNKKAVNCYLDSDILLDFPYDTHSIEVVFILNNINAPKYYDVIFIGCRDNNVSAINNASNFSTRIRTAKTVTKNFYRDTPYRVSSAKDACVIDLVNYNKSDNEVTWNNPNRPIIGARGTNESPYALCGKIYSIRIYNRLLTESEMHHNQEVDYDRFLKDIGKSIIVTAPTDTVDLTINGVKKTYAVTPNVPSKIVIDQSITSLNAFARQIHLLDIDLSNLDCSNLTTMYSAFWSSDTNSIVLPSDLSKCKNFKIAFRANNIERIDFSNTIVNTSDITSFEQMFSTCRFLTYADISNFDFNSATTTSNMFYNCHVLTYLKFGKNLKVSIDLSFSPLSHESALSVINGLAEVTTPQTVTFKAITYNTLTDEEIALATSKGWSVVSA